MSVKVDMQFLDDGGMQSRRAHLHNTLFGAEQTYSSNGFHEDDAMIVEDANDQLNYMTQFATPDPVPGIFFDEADLSRLRSAAPANVTRVTKQSNGIRVNIALRRSERLHDESNGTATASNGDGTSPRSKRKGSPTDPSTMEVEEHEEQSVEESPTRPLSRSGKRAKTSAASTPSSTSTTPPGRPTSSVIDTAPSPVDVRASPSDSRPSPGDSRPSPSESYSNGPAKTADPARLQNEAKQLKRLADQSKDRTGEPSLEGLQYYLQSSLKFMEVASLYEQKAASAMDGSDSKKKSHAMAIDLYRSTAQSTLRYFVVKSEKLDQPFLASLGEKCLAVCYGKCLKMSYPHLRHMHRDLTEGSNGRSRPPPAVDADSTKRFMKDIGDFFTFMEALSKAEVSVENMRPMPDHPFSVDLAEFVKYVRTELEKVST